MSSCRVFDSRERLDTPYIYRRITHRLIATWYKKYRVTLTAEEREELQALIAKGKTSARKLAHARVLLQVDETAAPGRTDEETAGALNLSVRTVERVCERFVEQGLTAALLPMPSQRVYARTFDGASEARLIALLAERRRRARPAGRTTG